ncbi:MAG: PAS domain S-box protein, partial [Burkholderiales bacterium]|nr:PAS domain S-box protein [Anaerolineae bacterium]
NVIVVFELEADGTTLFVNDAIVEMLGYTAAELLGHNWWDMLLLGVQHRQIENLNVRFQTGDVTQYQLFVTTRQGSPIVVELSTVNRTQRDGTLDRILGLVVDVTERRSAEDELLENHAYLEQLSTQRMAELSNANLALQQLAEMRQQLLLIERAALFESEQANRMKLQFLATVSHELRTPLTSIKGFAETLLATDVRWDAESQRGFIGIIDEEASKLNDLIEQLLDGARLQAGTLHVRIEPYILTTIISTAMTRLRSLTTQHQLIIDVPFDLPPILADIQRISGVLVNLVGNAVKFSPIGTRITVSAGQQDTMIQVNVSDEGPGIAVENREKVFEIFWQPELLTSRNSKGLGLGLAICRGIITAHGGEIWVADMTAGTTISFTLPTASAANEDD